MAGADGGGPKGRSFRTGFVSGAVEGFTPTTIF